MLGAFTARQRPATPSYAQTTFYSETMGSIARVKSEIEAIGLPPSVDRMVRLQHVIAALSGILTPHEVADTVLLQAVEALDADAGSVVLLTDDPTRLERASTRGYPQETLEQFGPYSITDHFPATEALQSGNPIWISSP